MIYFVFVHQREQETGGFVQWETLRCGDRKHLAGFAHTGWPILFLHASECSEKELWHSLEIPVPEQRIKIQVFTTK